MYTDNDLNQAIEKNIFTTEAVEAFRKNIETQRNLPSIDEENFRLVRSFNDIFVVIASALFLGSGYIFLQNINYALAFGFIALGSWALAEFFVKKRMMALPAIVLLLVFVGSVFGFFLYLLGGPTGGLAYSLSFLGATGGAMLHWMRFKVPVSVAAGVGTIIGLFCSVILNSQIFLKDYILFIIFGFGITTFALAMYWDSKDLTRVTRKSDVAFWLHLLAAPLIVHPLFLTFKSSSEDISYASVSVIVVAYLIMALVSLVVNRRVFMASGLSYVLIEFNHLFKSIGMENYVATTGIILGVSLLMLSAYWGPLRSKVMRLMPLVVRSRVPLS